MEQRQRNGLVMLRVVFIIIMNIKALVYKNKENETMPDDRLLKKNTFQ